MIGIDRGEVVATNGDVSSELDVLFYDNRTASRLLSAEGFAIYPVECVYGAVEVKSKLDARALRDAASKIGRLKALPKRAFLGSSSVIKHVFNLYGREWPYYPPIGMVFAYNSIDLRTLAQVLDELDSGSDPHLQVDSVWVLDKGMIVNWDARQQLVMPDPSPTTRRHVLASPNPLLLLVVQLQQLLQVPNAPRFRILDYLDHVDFGRPLQSEDDAG